MRRLVSPLTALVPLLVLSCNLLDGSGRITFQDQEDLYIHYGTLGANVDAVTLLAAGGEPLNGYTWTLSGGSFPPGTTVDPLTGVFRATGGTVSRTGGTFRMTCAAGSYSASKTYTVRARNWGSGPVPAAILQQRDPYSTDPSALILPEARVNKRYGASLYVLGGEPPYQWYEDLSYPGRTDLASVGLSIHRTNGVVVGTPAANASGKTVRFRYIVTDAAGDTAAFKPVYTIYIR